MEQGPEETQTFRMELGRMLREAREQLGMSVEDVAGRLKFAPRQIVALEAENFDQLPEMAFVRGFVRSYARLLQLDPAPLLDALPNAPAQTVIPEKKFVEESFPGIYALQKYNIIWLAAALVVALAIGIFAWKYKDGQTAAEPASNLSADADKLAGASSGIPAMQAMSASAVSVAASVSGNYAVPASSVGSTTSVAKHVARSSLRLVFDEDSWVEIKDGNGKILLSQIALGGSERNIIGVPPFAVIIGNAKGVQLYFKGNPVDLASHTNVDVAHLTLE